MLVHLHVVCGSFHTTVTEFSSYFRSHMAHKVEHTYYWPFTDKYFLPLLHASAAQHNFLQ